MDAREPGPRVKPPQLASRLSQVGGGMAHQLRQPPRGARGGVGDLGLLEAGAPRRPWGEGEREVDRAHPFPDLGRLRILEVLGRRAQDDGANQGAVIAGDQLSDGAAHRVADEDGGVNAELLDDGGGIGGAVGQGERGHPPQPASVAAVVDGQHAVAGLLQRPVGRVPVEVGGHRPAVQEHDGLTIPARVAQKEFASAGHDHRSGRRQIVRGHRRVRARPHRRHATPAGLGTSPVRRPEDRPVTTWWPAGGLLP
jgi:hypothetical protein